MIGLKSAYIQVNEGDRLSTGGSQNYFRDLPGFFNRHKHYNGCGIVAMGDLLMYLLAREGKGLRSHGVSYSKNFDSIESYRDYFNVIAKNACWIPTSLGVSSLYMSLVFNLLCIRFHLPYRARWGMLRHTISRNIERMLEADIPAILCIPYIVNPCRKHSAKLTMHCLESAPGNRPYLDINSHFVTVIGMDNRDGHIYYQVSSWGKRYEIDSEELDRLDRSVAFGGSLGNVLIVHRTRR